MAKSTKNATSSAEVEEVMGPSAAAPVKRQLKTTQTQTVFALDDNKNLALNQHYLSRAKMPCRTKSGTRKASSQNAKKPSTRKTAKAASKSVDTKENRYITDFFPTVSRRVLAAQLKLDNENKLIRHCVESCTDPEDNLMVTEFESKGKGIVARVPIKKDSFICEYSGDLIKLEDAEKREREYEASGEGCYMYYFTWNSVVWCVDATKPSGRLGRLINHSRKAPNCKTKVYEHNKTPHLIFIALRDIDVDEEVLYDYGERDPNAIRSNPWLTST